MKKILLPLLAVAFALALSACSMNTPNRLAKEGLAPYELSQGERSILQSFGMDASSQILRFNAPKEALSLNVAVYRLEEGGRWRDIGGGGLSMGADRKPNASLAGTFAMQLRDLYAIEFHLNTSGRASYKTDPIALDADILGSMRGFLEEFHEIQLNQEIPVALMVYDSGTSMRTYSLQDYFDPSKFDGMDLVQAVTLTFSDKA